MRKLAFALSVILLLAGCACTEEDDILKSITQEQNAATAP